LERSNMLYLKLNKNFSSMKHNGLDILDS
jgi:hypothetical protein